MRFFDFDFDGINGFSGILPVLDLHFLFFIFFCGHVVTSARLRAT